MSDDPRKKMKRCLLDLNRDALLEVVQAVVAEANPEAAQGAVDAIAEGCKSSGSAFKRASGSSVSSFTLER